MQKSNPAHLLNSYKESRRYLVAAASFPDILRSSRFALVLVKLNHAKDHTHRVVKYPPKASIPEMANAL